MPGPYTVENTKTFDLVANTVETITITNNVLQLLRISSRSANTEEIWYTVQIGVAPEDPSVEGEGSILLEAGDTHAWEDLGRYFATADNDDLRALAGNVRDDVIVKLKSTGTPSVYVEGR